jgi:N-carbamoylputrescine amidase
MREVITHINKGADSPARVLAPERTPLRIAAIQEPWHGSVQRQKQEITAAVQAASEFAPDLIVLTELSLYPYACTRADAQADFVPELLNKDGMSVSFAAELARASGAHVVISLYEDAGDKKFNTAVTVAPNGEVVLKTRKTHIPVTAGYYEDKYFAQGDSSPAVVKIKDAHVGTPTCWDQWFPELAREYGLIGTDLLCYPTAIGTEPDHPDFDTEPLWRQMMIAHGIANGLFVAAVNRTGTEDGITFYGSSFISDPYGRVLARAGSTGSAVLVADLDLDQKRDWLTLFPFFKTRRPSVYKNISAP